MATQGYVGQIDVISIASGMLSDANAQSIGAAGWHELKYVSATVNRSRNQVDITESQRSDPGMEKFPVLSDFNISVEFVKKKTGQAGFEAQQALKTALSAAKPERIYVRIGPEGIQPTANVGDEVEWGEVIVTGFNTTRPTNDVVRISLSLEGTGERKEGVLAA